MDTWTHREGEGGGERTRERESLIREAQGMSYMCRTVLCHALVGSQNTPHITLMDQTSVACARTQGLTGLFTRKSFNHRDLQMMFRIDPKFFMRERTATGEEGVVY